MTDPVGARCCGEHRCRRSQPILIRHGGLTGRWYAVTRYRDLGNGHIEALEKHDITDEVSATLRGVTPDEYEGLCIDPACPKHGGTTPDHEDAWMAQEER